MLTENGIGLVSPGWQGGCCPTSGTPRWRPAKAIRVRPTRTSARSKSTGRPMRRRLSRAEERPSPDAGRFALDMPSMLKIEFTEPRNREVSPAGQSSLLQILKEKLHARTQHRRANRSFWRGR